LIHLSNLTGLADDYNKRTMSLLVSDIGTIVMGITAAMATGYVKVSKGMVGGGGLGRYGVALGRLGWAGLGW
jgi:hypothetical protein